MLLMVNIGKLSTETNSCLHTLAKLNYYGIIRSPCNSTAFLLLNIALPDAINQNGKCPSYVHDKKRWRRDVVVNTLVNEVTLR